MDTSEPDTAAKPRVRRSQAERREDATTAILDAAEREFALRGREAATLRAIALGAGVDAALVHYYFRDKDGVYAALLERRFAIILEINVRSMDAYEARVGGALTIDGVLDAFLRPYCELLAKDPDNWADFAAILSRANELRSGEIEIMWRSYDPIFIRFIDMLMRISPATPSADIYRFFEIVVASFSSALGRNGRIDVLSGGLVQSADIMAAMKSIITVLSRGFEALAPAT